MAGFFVLSGVACIFSQERRAQFYFILYKEEANKIILDIQ